VQKGHTHDMVASLFETTVSREHFHTQDIRECSNWPATKTHYINASTVR